MRVIPFLSYLLAFITFSSHASAERLIESKSLNSCMDNSNLTATLFNVLFTPDNKTVNIDIVGVSSISGDVTADVEVFAYGHSIMKQTLNPCDPAYKESLSGFCPMVTGQLDYHFNIQHISDDVINSIPGMLDLALRYIGPSV
jgi:hypothetical protein